LRLGGMKRAIIISAVAALAVMAGDSSSVNANASVKVSPDTVAGKIVDTSAGKSVNTPGNTFADTSANASANTPADTSASTGVDTSAAAAVDTSANIPADTSAQTQTTVRDTAAPLSPYSSLFTETVETPAPVISDTDGNGDFPVNLPMILFFAASLAIIAATLAFFLRKKESGRFMTTTRLSVLDRMVQKGCRYIEQQYADPALSVDKVCEHLITGAAYLNVLFVKELGITVEDFIIQVRVANLKSAIAENPPENIENTCAQCGFASRAEAELHFARLTKTGMDEYIKSLAKPPAQ